MKYTILFIFILSQVVAIHAMEEKEQKKKTISRFYFINIFSKKTKTKKVVRNNPERDSAELIITNNPEEKKIFKSNNNKNVHSIRIKNITDIVASNNTEDITIPSKQIINNND